MNVRSSLDRRDVLWSTAAGLGAAALASACRSTTSSPAEVRAASRAAPAEDSGRVLVLLEMFGGNDGLSTLVPHRDDAYHRARPTLALRAADCLPLTDDRGLHPSLSNVHRFFAEGRAVAVEGVGFPAPIYSHFRSQEVWHTARREGRASGPGWIARLREGPWGDDPDRMLVVHVGGDLPYSLWSERHPAVSFRVASELSWLAEPGRKDALDRATDPSCDELESSRRERMLAELRSRMRDARDLASTLERRVTAYTPRADYPPEPFAASLRAIAALLQSDARTRVYSLVLSNFDTHGTVQRVKQAKLLAQLDRALGAFFDDLRGTQAEERVLVMACSEFGRRVAENVSHGTDHGAAGPLFFFGSRVRGGLHGAHPSLDELDVDGNLGMTCDFRRAYATALERWLGVDSVPILGAPYEPLELVG